MAEADWDARYRRTGFYEVVKRGGATYQRPINMYLVNILGTEFGPMIEPGDCFSRMEMGSGTAANSSERYWKMVTEYAPLGTRLNIILEQQIAGETPQKLHSFWGDWPA